MENGIFVDFYQALDLKPTASAEAIEHRFRHLARLYHPDNQTTGDRSRFDAVVEAHETLKDADKRARYHQFNDKRLPPLPDPSEAEPKPETEALDAPQFFEGLGIDRDLAIQNNLLMMLYVRRRSNPRQHGVGDAELERLSGCPAQQLEFHLWYLKSKGWISTGEDGLLSVTVEGVDRAAALYQEQARKLITDQT